ncbi:MAG: T9SS type A sorting domain-containing protein [Bacteroidota bacterium]
MIKTLLLLPFAAMLSLSVSGQIIHTLAGNGTAGYSGDGGTATLAQLNGPFGIAADAMDVYIADRLNNCVRKINAGGIITTVAGNGTGGYAGDGGPATAAQLFNITGVAVDAGGNIYIADKSNNRIRKVNSAGIISTIAGNGTAGYSGDGRPAIAAAINAPRGVGVDGGGNVYIADAGSQRVRKIDGSGTISTIAGTGVAGFSGDGGPAVSAQLYGPYNIAIDAGGNIYIADVDNNRIRKISVTGIITTVAGNGAAGYSGDGGAATAAALHKPIGVAVDTARNLFIADGWNARIRKVSSTGIITTIAGNGTPGYSGDGGGPADAQLNNPYGVAVRNNGSVFIADYANNRIRFLTVPTEVNTGNTRLPGMALYPNPSSKNFTVEVSTPVTEMMRVLVVAMDGRIVAQTDAWSNAPTRIAAEPEGVYLVKAITSWGVISKTIVVIQN